MKRFDLSGFEQLVANREFEGAAKELLALLSILRANHARPGSWKRGQVLDAGMALNRTALEPFATRVAKAVIVLFGDPGFNLSETGCQQFLAYHWLLATLVAASEFGNADDALRAIGSTERGQISFSPGAMPKFAVLHSLESGLPWDPEAIWAVNPQLAASHFLALCASPISASPAATRKREALMQWLPARLDAVELGEADFSNLFASWMFCSYALADGKHLLKAALNRQLRRTLISRGHRDSEFPSPRRIRNRPVILVIIEQFFSGHAMYRCFQPSIAALRKHFRLVALAREGVMDAAAASQFDEVHHLPGTGGLLAVVRTALAHARDVQPDMVFYPSLGLFDFAIAMANLRLAPIQAIGNGHPATSTLPAIDYFVTEEGFSGAPECFSEQILLMPEKSMPWTFPAGARRADPKSKTAANAVRIAVTASAMKLNAEFLAICRQIAQRANAPLEFHFFVASIGGLALAHVFKDIAAAVRAPVCHEHTAYETYVRELNQCDLYLDPIPFGNINGTVDAVRQHIPGVCLHGRELHARNGAEISRRLDLPHWLIANSVEEYIGAAVRLATDHACRFEISEALRRVEPDHVFFDGTPGRFADGMLWLYRNHESVKRSGAKITRLVDLATCKTFAEP